MRTGKELFTYDPTLFVDDEEAALDRLPEFRSVGPGLAAANRTERDVLWISEKDGLAKGLNNVRHRSIQDAIPKLYKLSNQHRADVLHGTLPVEAETAHTVLLPLDLDLGSMGDPHLIHTHGRFVFDVVLLVEGQVATAGFTAKALEKLIAGYAPLLYSLDNEYFDGAEELHSILKRLRDCGAREVIGVCKGRKDCELHHPFEECVRNAGLTWQRARWNHLIERPGI